MGLQFLNIKAWMLALTLVAGWSSPASPTRWQRFAIVAPVMLVLPSPATSSMRWSAPLLRHWLAQGQRLLWFNRAMAPVLALTAWWMASA